MTHLSADEVKQNCIGKLGDEFGNSYYHAYNEWCDLLLMWKQFRNLFCEKSERVDLLNRAGAGFFSRVDRLFVEAIFLGLCRLADPITTFGKPNLTVKLFQKFMDSAERKQKMAELLGTFEKSTDFARDWRNRRISHNDYGVKLGNAEPLKSATIELIDGALDALFQIFRYIELEFMNSDLYNEIIDSLNDEMAMLHRLFLGDEAFREHMEALERGEFIALKQPEWLTNH